MFLMVFFVCLFVLRIRLKGAKKQKKKKKNNGHYMQSLWSIKQWKVTSSVKEDKVIASLNSKSVTSLKLL